jgi:hypothetical protein
MKIARKLQGIWIEKHTGSIVPRDRNCQATIHLSQMNWRLWLTGFDKLVLALDVESSRLDRAGHLVPRSDWRRPDYARLKDAG